MNVFNSLAGPVSRRRLRTALMTFLLVLGFSGTNARAYLADIQTLGALQFLYLYTGMTNLAPVGTKIWFVADMNHDGVATNVTANGLIGGDNFLLYESFIDGSLFGSNPGRYRQNGLTVSDAMANANIYVYLWNTNGAAENGGDTFGILNLGVLTPPQFGNSSWIISNNIYADVFTLRAYNTNIWVANNPGNWSGGLTTWTNPPSFGGSSTNYLIFGGQTTYTATNDLGTFLMNNLEHRGSADVTLTGGALRFTNEYGYPLINQTGSGAFVISNNIEMASLLTLTGDSNGVITLTGVISGTNGLMKSGLSTYVLSNANHFTGGFFINGGTILVGDDQSAGDDEISFNAGTAGATLASSTAIARRITNHLAINSDIALGQSNGGTGTLTFTGGVNLGGGNRVITVNNPSNVFSGVVSNGGFVKDGGGLLLLSNNNTFTGSATVRNGVLAAGNTGALNSANPNLIFIEGGVLRLNGFDITVAGLNGTAGAVENNSLTSAALTLNIATNNISTYSGLLTDGASGQLKLIKSGPGAFIPGANNSYSGGTDIKAGLLLSEYTNGLGTGAVTLGGGSLALHYDTNATFGPGSGYVITLTNNSGISVDQISSENAVSLMKLSIGGLNIGTNTLLVTGGNGYSLGINGPSSMSGGTISAQSAIVRFNSNLVVSGANTFTGSNDIFLQGVVSGTGGIIKSGISNLVLAGSNTFTGGLTVNGGVVTLSNAGALNVAGVNFVTNNGGTIHLNGNNVTIAGLSGASGTLDNGLTNTTINLTINSSVSNSYSGVLADGTTGGKLNLIKIGVGTQTLGGANTYTGKTTVSNGFVQISAENNLGATPVALDSSRLILDGGGLRNSASLSISTNRGIQLLAGGGTFQSDSGTTLTINSVLNGAGTLTKTGNGTLSLAVSNTYTGITTVKAGTIVAVVNSPSGSAGAFGNASTVVVVGDTTGTNSATLLANGGTTVGRNLTVQTGSSGTKTVGSASASGTATFAGALTLNDHVTLTAPSGGTADFTGVISGAGKNITNGGGGTVRLSGASTNSFTGSATVNAGTLDLNKVGALGGVSSVTVNTGGTLLLSGNTAGRVKSTAPVTLAGGTINAAGHGETFGVLTLSANSIIDFGTGASVLNFADSHLATWAGGTILTIENWTGLNAGGGTDGLIFGGSVTALTSQQLGEIFFHITTVTDGLAIGTYGARILASGEVVPVPEPATWIATGSMLCLLGWRERSRLLAAFRRRR